MRQMALVYSFGINWATGKVIPLKSHTQKTHTLWKFIPWKVIPWKLIPSQKLLFTIINLRSIWSKSTIWGILHTKYVMWILFGNWFFDFFYKYLIIIIISKRGWVFREWVFRGYEFSGYEFSVYQFSGNQFRGNDFSCSRIRQLSWKIALYN